jgi:hypothetical protein
MVLLLGGDPEVTLLIASALAALGLLFLLTAAVAAVVCDARLFDE